MTFRERVIQLIQDETPIQMMACEVSTVDTSKRTIEVKDIATDVELYDIKLQSSPELSGGLLQVPKVGSVVIVAIINNDERNSFVAGFSELENLELNGSDLGGLVKAKELKTELDKTNQYITTLKTAVEAIATALDTLIPGTSVAFKTAMSAVSLGDYGDLENKKVTHG